MEEKQWRQPPNTSNQIIQQELADIRHAIDNLDHDIAALLNERLLLARKIGNLKEQTGRAVKDRRREQQVIDNVTAITGDQVISQAIASVYATLLEQSCAIQKMLEPATKAQAEPGGKPVEDATIKNFQPIANTKPLYFPRVLIVGLGLIGGAVARQIKGRLPNTTIIACDSPSVLNHPASAGLFDQSVVELSVKDFSLAVQKASLIMLCAPPEQNMQLLRRIAPIVKRRQVIVDVTSTKSDICLLAEQLPLKADFIGGHPLFGSHQQGIDASAAVTISGETFCLVPTKRSSEIAVRRINRWLTALGLSVEIADAQLHDGVLASTSHLVQILATALGSMLAQEEGDTTMQTKIALSGPALRAAVRLMKSPAALWLEIAQQNKTAICKAIDRFIGELQEIKTIISAGQDELLCHKFSCADKFARAVDAHDCEKLKSGKQA